MGKNKGETTLVIRHLGTDERSATTEKPGVGTWSHTGIKPDSPHMKNGKYEPDLDEQGNPVLYPGERLERLR